MSRFIVTLDDMLAPKVCAEMIARIDTDTAGYRGRASHGVVSDRKRSLDIDISGRPEWQDAEAALRGSLKRGIERYASVNSSLGSVERFGCRAFRLRRYAEGEFFDWHIDCFNRAVGLRILACVWYLNSPEGSGSTEFLYQAMHVSPRTGRLLLFPTSFEYVHRSVEVVDCAKYVAISFLEHL